VFGTFLAVLLFGFKVLMLSRQVYYCLSNSPRLALRFFFKVDFLGGSDNKDQSSRPGYPLTQRKRLVGPYLRKQAGHDAHIYNPVSRQRIWVQGQHWKKCKALSEK
jgi:hypothetical protein